MNIAAHLVLPKLGYLAIFKKAVFILINAVKGIIAISLLLFLMIYYGSKNEALVDDWES